DIRTDKVVVTDYETTNSKSTLNKVQFIIQIKAGNYQVKSFIYDQLSRTNYSNTAQYSVDAPYSSKRMLSKLRVYNLFNAEREIVRGNRFYDNDGQIEIEFYSYNPQRLRELTALVEISSLDGQELFSQRIDNILYDANHRAIMFAVLEKDTLKKKRSTIHISLMQGNTLLDETFAPLFFAWKIIPRTGEDMRTALEQMRYIVDPDTLSHYMKTNIEESQRFFKRFWLESSTLKTEADAKAMQDEYFERVNYANQHFNREYKKLKYENSGWATDRGRIYIKFGPPDQMSDVNVETLGAFKNYSVTWSYKLLQKKFVFFLSRKNGEYILDGKSESAEHSL
ncbi:MAG: GWxTD domain-containing protein, partial [Calditrichaeota bacterium]|nr:GWxTD domain-containing protein [Calditrichota bacterium]